MRNFEVKVDGKLFTMKLRKGTRVIDVMHEVGVNRETHLAKKNGKLVSELEEVSQKDTIEIFGVVYGG